MKKYILPILVTLLVPMLMQWTILDVIKLRTFDYFVDTPDPSGNFTILNITEQDVEDEGGYPFPRKRLAEIHQKIMNSGALGIWDAIEKRFA